MKLKLTLVALLTLTWSSALSQSYLWKVADPNTDTTYSVTTINNYYFPEIDTIANFDSLISIVKPNRWPKEALVDFQKDLDSLKKLPKSKEIEREIFFKKDAIESKFQILDILNYQVAVYDFDTVKVEDSSYPIFLFSTNFKTEWNEDHWNWFIFYSPKYGVLKTRRQCFWDYPESETTCQLEIEQRSKENIRNGILKELIEFCVLNQIRMK